ncbi:MAG TPA: outer membrane beta-barrel protein [Minicystis sp.]|nr:outer membrane beta-barrel protein [Minicystis sp.]
MMMRYSVGSIGLAALLTSQSALSQPNPAAPAAGPTAPATPPSTTPAAAPPEPVAPAPPAASTPAPAAAPAPAEKPAKPWYQRIEADAFVDAYAGINYNFPQPETQVAGTAVGGNQLRAFDVNNGFALQWAGIDVSYPADPAGATVALRFGPTADLVAGEDAAHGLAFLKQGFVSFRPGGEKGKFQLDFGKFDTFIGSEVAESQLNMNYTRSILFQLAQPLFHTGFRADFAPNDVFDFKLFAVNGWNRTIDNNAGKSFGAQVGIKPVSELAAYVSYLGGPEEPDTVVCLPGTAFDRPSGACAPSTTATTTTIVPVADANSRWRHIVDLVLDVNPTKKLRFLANADFVYQDLGASKVTWYGANLGIGYQFVDLFGAALRGGYLGDPDGFASGTKDASIGDATLTLALTPDPHLKFMLDNRIDASNKKLFQEKDVPGAATLQATTTLGLIVTTGAP